MRLLAAALLLAVAAPAFGQPRAPATPQARAAMADYARCIVGRSPDKAHSALTMDFRTRRYRSALAALSAVNRDCYRRRGAMRAGGLPFAAALAEQLLKRDASPLNVRLLRAAARVVPTYGPTDQIAMCIARSDADNVAALLNSPIASPAEEAAARALAIAKARCTPPGVVVQVDAYGLRSIVATASYRLLAAPTQPERG